MIADPEQRMAALLAGEIEFLHDPPFAELDRLASAPGVRLEQAMEFRTIFFGLDQGSPELRSSNVKGKNPFADLRVRQAVYQAIDIEAVRTGIMRGYAIPAGMIIQPGINGYTPEFDTRPAYDPDAAKDLLAEAGYPEGFEVGLDCPKNRYLNDEAICRGGRRHAGQGRHHRRSRDRPHGRAHRQAAGAADRLLHAGLGDADVRFPQPLRLPLPERRPVQRDRLRHPRVDELIDAIGTELVTYARDAMIEEVWRTVLADVVVVPLHHQIMVWGLRDRLELPIDALDLPRFRLARLKEPAAGASP